MRAWTEKSMSAGRYTPIGELIRNGTHTVEIFGNTSEGWQAYLVQGNVCLPISPLFHRSYGDTLRDCRAAACRAYGLTDVRKTRN